MEKAATASIKISQSKNNSELNIMSPGGAIVSSTATGGGRIVPPVAHIETRMRTDQKNKEKAIQIKSIYNEAARMNEESSRRSIIYMFGTMGLIEAQKKLDKEKQNNNSSDKKEN